MQTQKGVYVTGKEETQSIKSLKDLKPAQQLHGRITKIELFGAFVDVGLEQQGLIHISQLNQGKVNRVDDIVHQGDEVDVWVLRVDPNADRLDLTLVKPIALKWKDIRPGNKYSGEVIRLEKFGAFIDIGAERPGLVHVSEMRDEYVSDPGELVKVGEKVEVSVLDIDSKKRQIRLSMKAAEMVEDLDDEPEEALPTAMEIALREAIDGPGDNVETSTIAVKTTSKSRKELEDIYSRTLSHKIQTGAKKERE
ncbi:MAG: S1 RNA-binding domain-containing protein [Anaerolineales bacterium]|nr:S1 RNA-binding domain-containing protein [Anaerolineales bacterium]